MTVKINIMLNGRPRTFEVGPDDYLLDTLRNHHLYSVRKGCDSSNCGICTILMDGKPVLSCSILSVRADGHAFTTVEGIAEEADQISDYFGDEGADQCGFCNIGMALLAYTMKRDNVEPTEEAIRHHLAGNLCRCSGYQAQVKAIKRYMEAKR